MSTLRPLDLGISDSTINQVRLQSISWGRFKGEIPENPQYYAHIFWNIDYRYYFNDPNSCKPTVIARPYIASKSWKREELVSDQLLQHEYGHYLIGCICALKFQQKVNTTALNFANRSQAIQFCTKKFQETLAEYLEIEKKYDDETDHYYNQAEQTKWEKWIAEEINSMNPQLKNNENINRNDSRSRSRSKSIRSGERTTSIQTRSRNKSAKKEVSSAKLSQASIDENKGHHRPSSHKIRIRKTSASYPPLPPKAPAS